MSTFSKSKKVIRAEGGETLLALLRKAGIRIETPCGGMGTCGKCKVLLSNGEYVNACTYVPKSDVVLLDWPVPDPSSESILTGFDRNKSGFSDPLSADAPVFKAAVDIGTTTLAAYLLDAANGREAAVASRLNPQVIYGADVITRAQYVLEHGTEEMTHSIRKAVQEMLCELCRQAGIPAEAIDSVSIAGNTCMHHFFLGLNVDSLVHAPYVPAMKEAAVWSAADLGFDLFPGAAFYTFPNIAGFVGGDTVAGLVSTRLAEMDEWTLLIDIGTNGEIVLGKKHRLFACSAAAGPAFEGAGISCGMRGSEGAVSGARWEGDHFALDVIGGGPARGICGSGLLDLCAELLRSGQMDAYGGLCGTSRVLQALPQDMDSCGDAEGSQAVTLFKGDEKRNLRPVVLTQKDIRQLQLAKAAIAAGIDCLAAEAGIDVGEIRQVLLAGAFGSFLKPVSACAIGLIPAVLEKRIQVVGNASGAGAICVLQDPAKWEYAKAIASETTYVELAKRPDFQELFVEHMLFADEEE